MVNQLWQRNCFIEAILKIITMKKLRILFTLFIALLLAAPLSELIAAKPDKQEKK